ncbi:HhH-GPD family protein [Gulosibacter molinativorax]|uniref:A/G-specific adenine glycosylase n=1 Tax=Gulosibacter molinativorax TaxID=256821 RepID=A0ABT7C3M1_9MICO|nr:A/G-specific adenine glycosylase [Gulosibacter molinativorax]MDJ1369849.1 A/G-specific adenine glycosylase [Gulosibacter molinativorax]
MNEPALIASVRSDDATSADRSVEIVERVIAWFEANQRPFPWRDPDCSAWGILVSEVMSQQTQMSRVEPKWREFMELWPTPAAMAEAPVAEVIRRWDRLGYPRRAVNLHRCAVAIVAEHGGSVPSDRDALLALPAIGAYTSAAVASFAFLRREPVVDTNVRRVLARAIHGEAVAWPANSKRDEREMLALLPEDPARAKLWNAGAMELGAVKCQSKKPLCEACPIAELCTWRERDYPAATEKPRVQAKFEGSDRQLRGRVMAVLREHPDGVVFADLPEFVEASGVPAASGTVDVAHANRTLQLAEDLVRDGLAQRDGSRIRLPH